MSTPKFYFGRGIPWMAANQIQHQIMAQDDALAPHLRVYFAAIGYAAESGHANFGPKSEHGRTLARVTNLGSSANALRATREAVERRLILPGSGVRCLVLPATTFQKNPGRGKNGKWRCAVHGTISDRWEDHVQRERGRMGRAGERYA